jgi:hypothetical protein
VESTKEELEQGLQRDLECKANQLQSLEDAKGRLENSNEVGHSFSQNSLQRQYESFKRIGRRKKAKKNLIRQIML